MCVCHVFSAPLQIIRNLAVKLAWSLVAKKNIAVAGLRRQRIFFLKRHAGVVLKNETWVQVMAR